jgi:hypothetical protein
MPRLYLPGLTTAKHNVLNHAVAALDSLTIGQHASRHAAGGADALSGLSRLQISDLFNSPFWNNIPDKPASYPPSAHASTHQAGGTDVITVYRSQLEAPTQNVSLAYLVVIGKTKYTSKALVTTDSIANGDIQALDQVDGRDSLFARYIDNNNYYALAFYTDGPNHYWKIYKLVAGTATDLALNTSRDWDNEWHIWRLSASGTTLYAYVDGALKLTATDSTFSSGSLGISPKGTSALFATAQLLPTGTPLPPALGYYQVPIIGSGSLDDPYRADLPTGLVFSATIPTEKNGKPITDKTVVRVTEATDEAKAKLGNLKQLDRITARKILSELDPKIKLPDDW